MTFPVLKRGASGQFKIRYKGLQLKVSRISEVWATSVAALVAFNNIDFIQGQAVYKAKSFHLSFSQQEKTHNYKPLYSSPWKTSPRTKPSFPTAAPRSSRLFEGEASGLAHPAVSGQLEGKTDKHRLLVTQESSADQKELKL